MKTIVCCSFKGGTGKTSSAIHLGACLAKFHGKKILLIDFDSQANLSTGIGFGRDCLDAMPQVLRGEKSMTEIIQPTCIEGLYTAPANIFLDGIEATHPLTSDLYSHERLRKSLKGLEYDFCFIDTPPSLGWLTQSAFYASHQSIICVTPEPYSLLGLQRLKDYHIAIKENHDIEALGVLVTFWDTRGAANEAYLDSIESSFPGKTFDTKVRRDMAVNRAILKEKPVTEIEPTSRVAEDYAKLADEFLMREKNGTLQEKLQNVIDSTSIEVKHE
jgi:chromosome partitioning protein